MVQAIIMFNFCTITIDYLDKFDLKRLDVDIICIIISYA